LVFRKSNNGKTYCPKLWDEVYINQIGNVYSCCHEKPSILGSIYKNKLDKIYNNNIIQKAREQSIKGKLKCYQNCILLKKNDLLYIKKPIVINYYNLKILKITIGEACNISCIMCWQNHKNKTTLNYKKLIENVDLGPFKNIEVQGGEPLFIKEAKKFFNYASSKSKKISFLTNGTLMTREWAKKIVFNSIYVCFSINGATKETHEKVNRGSIWEYVLRNIKKVRNYKEKYRSDLKIIGHMTLVPENIMEITLFINTFSQLGFDCIDFGYDKKLPNYLLSNPEERDTVILRIKKAISCCNMISEVDMYQLQQLNLL